MTRRANITLGLGIVIAIATGVTYWNHVVGIENRRSAGVLLASEITWKGGMGGRKQDGDGIYVIMGRGFMSLPFIGGTPTTVDDFDQHISKWLKSHRRAVVVPVSFIVMR